MSALKLWIRALRLPFTGASVLPFILGCLSAPPPFVWLTCISGIVMVAATHLAANLINDIADTHSGADTQDPVHYGFFGGSKLIEPGRLSSRAYAIAATICLSLALGMAVALTIITSQAWFVAGFLLAGALGWAYSCPPLKLSYRGLGEITIALLFGTATVVAGWMSQTAWPPPLTAWLISLVPGMLTAAILAANEVPDCNTDREAGKNTLVVLVGDNRGYLVFVAFSAAAYIFLALLILGGILTLTAALAFIGIVPAYRCAAILRRSDIPKTVYIQSAKLSILQQALVVLIIMGERILWRMS